ncbi:MAG: DUF72 domain-containing protein [Candidatus Eiseniibacteriota bacterium]
MSDTTAPRVLVGTSGYSFPDWVGPFYPSGTRSGEFLSFYARHFGVVEVNSTYYRIPQPRMLWQMEQKTPDGFRFVVKLHQSMTHEGSLDPASFRDFLAALTPLKDAGKYDGLLAQFPWAFRFSPRSLDHLRALRERLPGEPLFVEFRHASWTEPSVPARLREQHLGFCAVDEPDLPGLMPAVTHVTAEDAYVRLHGRNAQNWWARPIAGQSQGDRYDYDYSPAELGEWVKKVAELATQARRTYVFFNNCHAGQAARNAALMKELLRQQSLSP